MMKLRGRITDLLYHYSQELFDYSNNSSSLTINTFISIRLLLYSQKWVQFYTSWWGLSAYEQLKDHPHLAGHQVHMCVTDSSDGRVSRLSHCHLTGQACVGLMLTRQILWPKQVPQRVKSSKRACMKHSAIYDLSCTWCAWSNLFNHVYVLYVCLL